jgi:hypothetical protein
MTTNLGIEIILTNYLNNLRGFNVDITDRRDLLNIPLRLLQVA